MKIYYPAQYEKQVSCLKCQMPLVAEQVTLCKSGQLAIRHRCRGCKERFTIRQDHRIAGTGRPRMKEADRPPCKLPNCDRASFCKGLCRRHYRQGYWVEYFDA